MDYDQCPNGARVFCRLLNAAILVYSSLSFFISGGGGDAEVDDDPSHNYCKIQSITHPIDGSF
jgi:hypothetical protein